MAGVYRDSCQEQCTPDVNPCLTIQRLVKRYSYAHPTLSYTTDSRAQLHFGGWNGLADGMFGDSSQGLPQHNLNRRPGEHTDG